MVEIERIDKEMDKFDQRLSETDRKLQDTNLKLELNNQLTEQNTKVMEKLSNTLEDTSSTMREISFVTKQLVKDQEELKQTVKDSNEKIDFKFAEVNRKIKCNEEQHKVDIRDFIKSNWYKIVITSAFIAYIVLGKAGIL